jgi:mannose-6-phosphate isomerase-like protein (cupin superfamily)
MSFDSWKSMRLPASPTVKAPDGSDVRVLLASSRGSCAHFELAGGQTSTAVVHRTVEEIWFFLTGRGEMWLAPGQGDGDVIDVMPGDCLTIPVGTRFQFRAHGSAPLAAVGVTMPPWPGENEAIVVDGRWEPTVR